MHRNRPSTKGDAVAHHNQNGERNTANPDEHRPGWRPEDPQASSARRRANEDDHDYRSWRERNDHDGDRHAAGRDPRRWEGGRGSELGYSDDRDMGRSTERHGQGQSGHAPADRYGEDRSRQMQNRNEMVPSPGSFEDRHHDRDRGDRGDGGERGERSVDDRFSGRGVVGYWQDRGGYGPERYGAQGGYGGGSGFDAERLGVGRGSGQRGGSDGRGGTSEWRTYDQDAGVRTGGHDQHMGYRGGSGHGSQSMGYQSSYGPPPHGTQDDWQRHGSSEPHVHRGTGPHRGKGPVGYQRSDERIRELVSEALTDDDQIDASQIHVSVKDGEVTLSGIVEDRRTRREAEDCVASVSGVRDVQVQLRMKDDRPPKT